MQDFELHYQKPPISNMILIVLAIKSMKNQKASAQQIFDFVENTFPYYQDPQKSQRNTLRCTLSANKSFVLSKEVSTKGLKKQRPGVKGSFWLFTLHPIRCQYPLINYLVCDANLSFLKKKKSQIILTKYNKDLI